MPSPISRFGRAFDTALSRCGWVALHVQYEVAACRDGSFLNRTMLPPAWHVRPAASTGEVLLDLYHGRSREGDEPVTLAVVNPDG